MAVSQELTLKVYAQSTASNTSNVTLKWTSTQSGESHNDYERTAYYWVSINGGEETKHEIKYTLPQNTTATILSKTLIVKHKDDGTATVKVRTWMDTGISAGVIEKTESIALPTIARAPIINSLSSDNGCLNGTIKCDFTCVGPSYYYSASLQAQWPDGQTVTMKTEKGGTYGTQKYTVEMKLDETVLGRLYSKWPSASKIKMRVAVATYKDSSHKQQVGTTSSGYVDFNIPNDETTQPDVGMELSPLGNPSSKYNGVYVQGYSKVKAALTFEPKYEATVVGSSITVNGVSYESPYESATLTQSGTVTVKATAKDSRGFYGTNYKDIEVIAYQKPYLSAKSGESSIIVARCNASAALTDEGTYLKIRAKAVYSKVISGGEQKNYAFIRYRYRKEGGAYNGWQTILDCKNANSDEVITPPLLNGGLEAQYNYQVQILVSDDFGESVPMTFVVPSVAVYMDRPAGGKRMGLGGYSTRDGSLDIYWNTIARGGLSLLDSNGTEMPLGYTLPLPHGQVASGYNPDGLGSGIYVVANNIGLKSGESVIMSNGVLIQMQGDAGGNVKIQLALPVDTNRNPMYRICWYSNWSAWRSMKL